MAHGGRRESATGAAPVRPLDKYDKMYHDRLRAGQIEDKRKRANDSFTTKAKES